VAVSVRPGDLLDGDGGDVDVVLAGDVFYSEAIAARMWPFLHRAAARGARVLVGDPGRGASASGPADGRNELPGASGRRLRGTADQPDKRAAIAMTSRCRLRSRSALPREPGGAADMASCSRSDRLRG
jgi:hypothetical protein